MLGNLSEREGITAGLCHVSQEAVPEAMNLERLDFGQRGVFLTDLGEGLQSLCVVFLSQPFEAGSGTPRQP